MDKLNTLERFKTVLFSVCISILLFITLGGEYLYKDSTNSESKLVIDDMNIEFIYDDDTYELIDTLNSPYAVIKGDTDKLNLLKASKNYKFYVDLTGYIQGNYNVKITYEGIPQGLSVDIYPLVFEVIVAEKQTIEYEPSIEIVGSENLNNDLIVGVPEIVGEIKKIKVRDTSEKLNSITNVSAKIDVSNFTQTKTVDVEVNLFDAEGNLIKDANVIDNKIKVSVPITKKVNNIIIQENNKEKLDLLQKKLNVIESEKSSLENEKSTLEKLLGEEKAKNIPSNKTNKTNPSTNVPKENTNSNKDIEEEDPVINE